MSRCMPIDEKCAQMLYPCVRCFAIWRIYKLKMEIFHLTMFDREQFCDSKRNSKGMCSRWVEWGGGERSWFMVYFEELPASCPNQNKNIRSMELVFCQQIVFLSHRISDEIKYGVREISHSTKCRVWKFVENLYTFWEKGAEVKCHLWSF